MTSEALTPEAVRVTDRGNRTPIRWDVVDPLLREGKESLRSIARRLGISDETLRVRSRKLGLPPRRGAPGYQAVVEEGRVVDLLACGHVVEKRMGESATRRFCPECQEARRT